MILRISRNPSGKYTGNSYRLRKVRLKFPMEEVRKIPEEVHSRFLLCGLCQLWEFSYSPVRMLFYSAQQVLQPLPGVDQAGQGITILWYVSFLPEEILAPGSGKL